MFGNTCLHRENHAGSAVSIPSLAVRPNRHQLSFQTANIAWLYGSCQKAASAVLRESFHLLHTPAGCGCLGHMNISELGATQATSSLSFTILYYCIIKLSPIMETYALAVSKHAQYCQAA